MATAAQLAAPAAGPFTWHDYLALADDDRRELFDGYLLEADVATALHEWIVAYLITVLNTWAFGNGGRALASAYKVRISDRRAVMPDVQFYRRGRSTPAQALTEGGPDLAVEVISAGSRGIDSVTKLRYYLQIGVPEYWLVDPEAQTLTCFVQVQTAAGPAWQVTHALGIGDGQFAPPTFAGLCVDLQRLFTVPD